MLLNSMVVVFPSWFPGLARDPRFRPIHVLPIVGNVTMGGDEIVVYETPWTGDLGKAGSATGSSPSRQRPAR